MAISTERYTWIPFYGELARKLLDYEDRQAELIAITQEMNASGLLNLPFLDQAQPGVSSPLTEIDPFTFIGIFNRRTRDEKRFAITRYFKERFSIQADLPEDFDSIPILDARKSWFFPYQYERKPDDIPCLWRMFRIAMGDNPLAHPDFDSAFNRALAVKNVRWTLTMALYWIRPDVFLSADGVNQDYLQCRFDKLNAENYRVFVQKGQEAQMPFPKLSYQAHLSRLERKSSDATVPEEPPISQTNEIPEDSAELAQILGISQETLEGWLNQLQRKRQIILQGPPGTGKTFVARHLANWLTRDGGKTGLVQFHPSYSYEDFIQGYRPESANGQLVFDLKPGVFKRFCEEATQTDQTCMFIIDEINRANLSSVFGELMYLLEYRNQQIQLQSGEPFSIPDNVLIIGTMNTADRSIALMDHALRRRFAFIELLPQYDLIPHTNRQALTEILMEINAAIDDPHYWLGHSYFMGTDDLQPIWEGEIYPYLSEYFIDQRERIEPFTWQRIKSRLTGAYENP